MWIIMTRLACCYHALLSSMDFEDEGPNTTSTAGPCRMCYLLVGLCTLAIIVRWSIRRSLQPGGLLHGARNWYRSWFLTRPTLASTYQRFPDDCCDLHDSTGAPLPTVRTVFGGGATSVYGWPSTGGVWVHGSCYGVELDFLGLSRFETSPTQRFSDEEDEFCKRLEWIGARFYTCKHDYHARTLLCYSKSARLYSWYAWPGTAPDGGVWVLRTMRGEGMQLGVSRIRNALSMTERCQAIEMLGGKFYEKWEDIE